MKNFKIYIAGNTEKELVAPKQVVNVERFGTDIQLEYDRQHYLQLSDKYGKAVASRTKALEKGEVSKVKKADLDAKVETAKEALDTFKIISALNQQIIALLVFMYGLTLKQVAHSH